jgi:hypothetical protein
MRKVEHPTWDAPHSEPTTLLGMVLGNSIFQQERLFCQFTNLRIGSNLDFIHLIVSRCVTHCLGEAFQQRIRYFHHVAVGQ